MELHLSRTQIEWLCWECFPIMQDMSKARTRLHTDNEPEYWNSVIVSYVLTEVVKKFERKLTSKKLHHKVNLEPAEAATLYRFLFPYRLPENQHWKIQTQQFIIDQLHRLMIDTNIRTYATFTTS